MDGKVVVSIPRDRLLAWVVEVLAEHGVRAKGVIEKLVCYEDRIELHFKPASDGVCA